MVLNCQVARSPVPSLWRPRWSGAIVAPIAFRRVCRVCGDEYHASGLCENSPRWLNSILKPRDADGWDSLLVGELGLRVAAFVTQPWIDCRVPFIRNPARPWSPTRDYGLYQCPRICGGYCLKRFRGSIPRGVYELARLVLVNTVLARANAINEAFPLRPTDAVGDTPHRRLLGLEYAREVYQSWSHAWSEYNPRCEVSDDDDEEARLRRVRLSCWRDARLGRRGLPLARRSEVQWTSSGLRADSTSRM